MTYESPKQALIEELSPIETSCVDRLIAMSIGGVGGNEWRDLPRAEKYERLSTLVGNTPIKQVGNFNNANIYCKFETENPFGSHYDRAFLATIQAFENDGLIKPGDELRDITSGSGGISLAALARELGYKGRLTVPDELPENRLFPMEFFGAEIVKAGPGYMKRASAFQTNEIQVLKEDPEWKLTRPSDREQRAFVFTNRHSGQRICYLNHSENLLSVEAFRAIGREIITRMSGVKPHNIALAMGNWTTIAGISPVIRSAWPDTRLIGYEGENTKIHDNFGTSVDGLRLRFRDEALLDETVVVSDNERDQVDSDFNNRLEQHEQFGHSSLMGLVVAQKIARETGQSTLSIAYDQKIRY